MELIYLYHSGFALLGEGYTLVVDYFEDSESATNGIWHRELLHRPGRLYVLSSHSHADHFNPEILKWKAERPDVAFVFSRDICQLKGLAGIEAVYLDKGEVYEDDLLRVRAFGSTDIGISFLMEMEGKKVFHAGDLNNWHWMDESEESEWRGYERHFLQELATLSAAVERLDVVMFPVDPRLGREYMRGPRQFIGQIPTGKFVPMHFDEAYDLANAFEKDCRAHGTVFLGITRRGQRMII